MPTAFTYLSPSTQRSSELTDSGLGSGCRVWGGAGGDAADVLSYLNKSMRILDLGCGTGLCGAWFTDYAKDMVGVDIAPNMIEQVRHTQHGHTAIVM